MAVKPHMSSRSEQTSTEDFLNKVYLESDGSSVEYALLLSVLTGNPTPVVSTTSAMERLTNECHYYLTFLIASKLYDQYELTVNTVTRPLRVAVWVGRKARIRCDYQNGSCQDTDLKTAPTCTDLQ